ncbi:D-glycero-alpha-D-manno-heptose-1,7-bisphosphate 7-phosphatase [Thalassomonas sp. M1454]|uniref:D-glycero-alpha-D-manno-heptose-1,7-bisphosphate 7-phosphatase n=1 Tax=Thalassomonas sp. M1454 TaxID=2594477 RepID=UPI001180C021|nr:HAD family hydrolase [Thalassomonas sp. M1454]TRX55629.1 HAD family hydrolase [Thalassomonas sp. M1454]
MNKALFLSRDGVINIDRGYVYKSQEFEFVDGIFDVCRFAQELGYQLIVTTNQHGIARGVFTEKELSTLFTWMKDEFLKEKIIITDVFYCPHHPTKGKEQYKVECDCRKPEPGMILKAAIKHKLDLKQSIYLGNKAADIKAAQNAGIHNRILLSGKYSDDGSIPAHIIANICTAIEHID